MLTKKSPETLPARLKIDIHGTVNALPLDYRFMTTSEFDAIIKEEGERGLAFAETTANIVLRVVKSWESEYELSKAGLLEMEDAIPGMMGIIIGGFHEVRGASRAKN